MNEKLDPSIFRPEHDSEGPSSEAHSETPPKTSWASAPSAAPPAGEPNTAEPAGAAGKDLRFSRVNTPRGILAPGSEFGVYRVGACIGEGGMARIYQAEHSGLQRQVALKVLIDGVVGAGEESHERFLREARMAAAIKHPNVVNIFDVGLQEGTPFLVMELLWGTDLESLIAAKGALDEGFIIDIMIPIVAGLAAVHDAGIVHRDLKPGNIFLSNGRYEEIEPKLLDFGISRSSASEQLRLTTNGLLMGTPFYMSPEGLRGEEMTPQSDQYSLGVVMYECATGHNPFNASTFAEIFQLIGSATFARPTLARPGLSKRFERIVLRAMSLDPADRFADLRELGRELLLLAGQRTRVTWALSFGEVPRTALANAISKPSADAPAAPARSPRKRALLTVLAALALLLAISILWLETRPRLEPVAATAGNPAAGTLAVTEPPPSSATPPAASAPSPPAEGKPRAAQRVEATGRIDPRQKRSGRAAAVRPEGPDAELQWSVPVAPAPATAAKSSHRTGANGAPILD